MLETISVNGIAGYGYHGVLDHERVEGQEFSVDVEYSIPMLQAARTDDLTDTLSYADVAQRAHGLIVGEPFRLIESLAHAIADAVITAGPVTSVTVRVHKPHAPIPVEFADVVLTVERSQADPLRALKPATIAFGSNLGDTEATVSVAIAELGATDGVTLISQSDIMTTTALTTAGLDETKPKYANAVVNVETTLSPIALLDVCQSIENSHGRVRAEKWGNRTLDLDIIDYAGEVWHSPRLVLPHPEAHKRTFVIDPWLQIDPDAQLPGIGRIVDIHLDGDQA